ncbi:MAG: ArsB/NhaD family transporter [Planctomycetota bacterium]
MAAAEAAGESPAWVMTVFAVGMLLTFVGVAADRFHKTVAALCGAVVLVTTALGLGLFEYGQVYRIIEHDLNIFGVIIGTGILVDVTGRSGLFHFLGLSIVRATRGRASTLYFALCGLTFLFVAVLTIVPAMLILGSLTLVICKTLDYDPKPYMLSVAICANSGAIATFASGLPNIMIGTAAEIPYVQFLEVSLPFAVLSAVTAIALLRWQFANDIAWSQPAEVRAELAAKVDAFDPWSVIESRSMLVRSAVVLGLTVTGFAAANSLGVGVDFVAMAGGTLALLVAGREPFTSKGVEDAIAKVNWTVILFFLGLFLIIGCVQATGALAWLAEQVAALSAGNVVVLVPLLTVFSAVASAIVDNIPVAATLIPITKDLIASGVPDEPLWWTLVLACNLGGNGTPIGSISCVIALYTLKKEAGVSVGWPEFLKLGGTILLVQMIEIALYVLILFQTGLFPELEPPPSPEGETRAAVSAVGDGGVTMRLDEFGVTALRADSWPRMESQALRIAGPRAGNRAMSQIEML